MAPKADDVHFTSLEEIGAQMLFEKRLTNSDMSGQGRLVVPKVSEVVEKPTVLMLSLLVQVNNTASAAHAPTCTFHDALIWTSCRLKLTCFHLSKTLIV
jgi:hypothetical protein